MAKHHESHGSRGTRRSTVEPRVAYSRHAETHSAHGSQLHYGQHASHRSAAAIAAQRTRRIAVLVVAAVVAVALVITVGVVAHGWFARQSAPSMQQQLPTTAHKSLTRKTVPQLDPGNIVIGVNGSETTYVLKGEQYVEGGAHAIEPEDGVLTGNIVTTGTVDTNTPGDYTVQYTVHDSTGHEASATRTVKVVDTMDKQTGGIPVLMYHYVYDPANPPADVDANWIPTTSLEPQLQYLTQNNFYYPSWPEVRAFIDGKHSLPKNSIVMTFDDGEPHFFQYGSPLLAKYKVPATSFVIGADGEALNKMKTYATPYLEYESHSFDMHRAGGTVGHGGRISAMSHQEIVDDLKQSEQVTGSLQAFAYPFGDTTPDAIEAVRETGTLAAFTTQYGWADVGADPMNLPRVRIQGTGSLDTFIAAIQ